VIPVATRARQQGFTLLEIMVVLVIIGVFVSLATMSLRGPDRVGFLEEEANRLRALIEMAAEESVMQYQEIVLDLKPHSYEFMVLKEGKRFPFEGDEMFRLRELPDDIELNAIVEGETMQSLFFDGEKTSQILLLSSGEMSPFEITMQLRDGPAYRLEGSLTGNLVLEGPLESL